MDTAIKKGIICKIDATIDVSGLSKVWRKTYSRMIRMNADYYIVLRSADNDEVLCVPLLREKNRHSVRLVINSTSYYADYLVFLSAPATWFVYEKVRVSNTLDSVHKIYEARKAHNLNVLERKRKKEQQKREDKRLRKEIQALSKGSYPKEQAPSAVAWNITHPFQGGRTGSK